PKPHPASLLWTDRPAPRSGRGGWGSCSGCWVIREAAEPVRCKPDHHGDGRPRRERVKPPSQAREARTRPPPSSNSGGACLSRAERLKAATLPPATPPPEPIERNGYAPSQVAGQVGAVLVVYELGVAGRLGGFFMVRLEMVARDGSHAWLRAV